MSLVQSAKVNGHEPWAYLRNVLERIPRHPNSRIDELLPHRWRQQGSPDVVYFASLPQPSTDAA